MSLQLSVQRPKIVIDTNTMVRAVASTTSPSGRIINACLQRDFILLLSRPVMAEYRQVLSYQKILARSPEITGKRLLLLLQRLRFFSHYLRSVPVKFEFERDPDDAKFIELAIAGEANFIITRDDDLLALNTGHSDAAHRFRRRLPSAKILRPEQFLNLLP